MDIEKCKKCKNTNADVYWARCEEHYICDDCGTREYLCHYTEGLLCYDCHKKRTLKRVAEFKDDTSYTNDVICPWCGHKEKNSWEMSEGETECCDCENKFKVTRDVSVTYTMDKIGGAVMKSMSEALWKIEIRSLMSQETKKQHYWWYMYTNDDIGEESFSIDWEIIERDSKFFKIKSDAETSLQEYMKINNIKNWERV